MSSDLVDRTLERFFRQRGNRGAELRILVAFSGGPDSAALLSGLARLAPRLPARLFAAHVDHRLDPDSGRRARDAARLAGVLGVPVVVARCAPEARGGDGPEANARRARYGLLARLAGELEADFVATAHHADDQAETVLLRIAFGSGILGLAGIRPVRPLGGARLVRPLLGLGRTQLRESLEEGLAVLADPTNDDLSVPRNRVRRLLLPRLERFAPGLTGRLGGVAAAARAASGRLDEILGGRLDPRPVPYEAGVQVDRAAFESLPQALVPHALSLLHRRVGAPYPAGLEARRELARQLSTNRGRRVGCDCGAGWRWEAASGLLQLVRRPPPKIEFAYTVEAPGGVEIPHLGLRLRLRQGRVAPWMFRAWSDRAGLADVTAGAKGESRRFEVRSRRPGDRMTPLGRRRRCRLKDLLIDRRVPRRQRDRLPVLVVDGEIAWVPGLTIAERFRLGPGDTRAWIVEVESSPTGN